MKVIGQLERAQLENSTPGTLPGPASTGRVYADITAPTAAIPRFYNGTAWVPLSTGQTTALIQNTPVNGAVTVNWANGLFQQVVLNGHTVITFSNPQSGREHRLIVTQRATEGGLTPYMYSLNMPDQFTRRLGYQKRSVLQSSESDMYVWFYSAGIKPAYGTIPTVYGNPGTVPTTLPISIDIFPGQGEGRGPQVNTLLMSRTSSPFSQSIQFYDGGSKFFWQKLDISTPTAAAAAVLASRYSPDGHTAFLISGTTPYLQALGVDIYGVPNQNAYANPGTLPTGGGTALSVHPSGSHVLIGHQTTPFMSCYPINSGAFGTKLTNPTTLPPNAVKACEFNPTGDFVAVGNSSSPFLQVYPFDPVTGFGTVLSNPGTLPAAGPDGVLGSLSARGFAWHPAGTFLAMAMSSNPFLCVYAFNRSTGTIGAQTIPFATGAPGASISAVSWSPCGNYLVAVSGGGVFLYDMSAGTGLPSSAPLTFDGAAPGVTVNDVVWHPSGEIIFLALNSSPFVMAYPAPRKVKNYMKLTL